MEGTMIARDDLHAMLDAIPEDRLEAAREALAALADRVQLALTNAPEDDEPLTEDDLQAIADGRDDAEHGRTITLDEHERRLRATTR
jgi:hypothetical protein